MRHVRGCCSRYFFTVFFGDVDGEHDQAFVGKFFVDLLHQRFFIVAVLAPGGPKLEQNNFAFGRLIVEHFAGGGFGAEARGGLIVVIVAGECKSAARTIAGRIASRRYARMAAEAYHNSAGWQRKSHKTKSQKETPCCGSNLCLCCYSSTKTATRIPGWSASNM
jgi:hypothetical protein